MEGGRKAATTTIVQPQRRTRKAVNLSEPAQRRAPPPRKRKMVRNIGAVESPVKPPIADISKIIANDGNSAIVDNTKSSIKRNVAPGLRESKFLITFVPNSSVREDINPGLYKELKNEIESFARYILDPRNMRDILKATADNTQKDWFSRVVRYGADRVASIEDSKDSNKRLHTHIYLPVYHKTKLQVDVDNVREIAKIMLEPLGVKGPRVDVKVERQGYTNARDYVLKGNTDSANRELIK